MHVSVIPKGVKRCFANAIGGYDGVDAAMLSHCHVGDGLMIRGKHYIIAKRTLVILNKNNPILEIEVINAR